MARQALAAVFTDFYYKFLSWFEGAPRENISSVYEFTLPALDGNPVSFDKYKGKYLLIVNTASRCAFTPQYASLEKLHESYGGKVAVLGFPANNFMWQESGSNEAIAEFCQKNYGVKFQMFQKISVKGSDKSPLYRWLEQKTGKSPSWNFCKYLVDPNGQSVHYFSSKVDPMSEEVLRLIE